MNKLSTKSNGRLSLAGFKAIAGAANVQDQVQMITGGALASCHTPPKAS